MSRIILVYFTIVFFCVGSFSNASSGKGEIDINFRGENISAELQEVPLRLIFEKLKREKGVWFKGDESLLDRKVFVRFKDLPLHKGLKRILSDIDHVFIFDKDQRLVGLYIFSKSGSFNPMDGDEDVVGEKALTLQPAEKASARRNAFGQLTDEPSKSSQMHRGPFGVKVPREKLETPIVNPFER